MGRNSGKFQLEPDGFSIHTFELTKKLSRKEYRKLVDEAYCHCPPGQIYRDKTWQGNGERHRCKWFQREGLRISFEQDIHHQVVSRRLRIAVNPRKLIDPNTSYLGILPPTEESVGEVSKAFFIVLKKSGLPCVLDAYQLSRVDLCVNVRCDSTALFKELLRVTRKLPTPPKYERAVFRSENKKFANKYNKHHITLKHKSRELVLYDKTYQILENGLLLDEEKLPKGVLRFEVHEPRERVSCICSPSISMTFWIEPSCLYSFSYSAAAFARRAKSFRIRLYAARSAGISTVCPRITTWSRASTSIPLFSIFPPEFRL